MPLPNATLLDIAWALAEFRYRRPDQHTFRAYMAGLQQPSYMTKQYARAFQELLKGLRLNICPAVVHAVTDRLKVIGFSPNDAADKDAAAAAWSLWKDRRLDRHSNKIHNEALVAGDAYLIVWPDAKTETPAFYPQRAVDCVVRYDPELLDQVTFAARLWLSGRRWRINLYYPDRIEKYQTTKDTGAMRTGWRGEPPADPDQFDRYEVPGESWPLNNPFEEVPVFHFAYGAGIGEHGISELRDVIPLQNSINKTLADMLVASEFGAYRQRWMTGGFAEPQTKDVRQPDGTVVQQQVPMELGMNRFLINPNKDASFGEFSATDLGNFINAIDSLVADVARIKGIPLHEIMMTGTFPSGESQKTAETRLVAKVEHTQVDFGDVWEDAFSLALKMQGTQNAMISAEWAEAASRAELEHVQAIGTKVLQIGLPEQQAWRELGYSEEQIAEFAGQQQAARAVQQTSAADALAAALARG